MSENNPDISQQIDEAIAEYWNIGKTLTRDISNAIISLEGSNLLGQSYKEQLNELLLEVQATLDRSRMESVTETAKQWIYDNPLRPFQLRFNTINKQIKRRSFHEDMSNITDMVKSIPSTVMSNNFTMLLCILCILIIIVWLITRYRNADYVVTTQQNQINW